MGGKRSPANRFRRANNWLDNSRGKLQEWETKLAGANTPEEKSVATAAISKLEGAINAAVRRTTKAAYYEDKKELEEKAKKLKPAAESKWKAYEQWCRTTRDSTIARPRVIRNPTAHTVRNNITVGFFTERYLRKQAAREEHHNRKREKRISSRRYQQGSRGNPASFNSAQQEEVEEGEIIEDNFGFELLYN